jgi:hypothetical protein
MNAGKWGWDWRQTVIDQGGGIWVEEGSPGRRLGISPSHRRGRLGQQCLKDHRSRGAVEGQLTSGHLVQHDAERPQIGARIHCLAARLLGRHVGPWPLQGW